MDTHLERKRTLSVVVLAKDYTIRRIMIVLVCLIQ